MSNFSWVLKPRPKMRGVTLLLLWVGFQLLLPSRSALAITDTAVVPAGVRALIYRSVWASTESSYDPNGIRSGYNLSETLQASKLAPMVPQIKDLAKELEAIDKPLADQLNFGTVAASAHADVHANAIGLAYGIADGLMLVGTLPIISASVHVEGGYQTTNSVQQTIASLQTKNANLPLRSQRIDALVQVLQQLPSPTGGNLQAAIVDGLGYKPVGDWTGSGIGDADFFAHYRFVNEPQYRQALRLGMVLPTGRQKDPDNLVDIPFGKGNASTYLQTIHDFPFFHDRVTLHAQGKFDYQWAASRTYRLYTDPGTPLSSEKEKLEYQRGNRWSLGGGTSLTVVPGVKLTGEYEYTGQFRDSLSGGNKAGYDYSILTQNSNSEAHVITTGLSFSTVPLFLKKKFPLPLLVALNYSRVFGGVNTDAIDMTYLHLEVYF